MRKKRVERSSSDETTPAETEPQVPADDDEQVAVLIRVVPPWLLSMLVHVALILVLAILTLTNVVDNQVSLTVDTANDVEDFTEITVLEFEELELDQDSATENMMDSEVDLASAQLISPVALQTTEVFEFSDFNAGLGEMVEGLEALTEDKSTTSFFGAEQSARKVVFVVDNSNSMSKGKFETALTELSKTVGELSPKQQFHVIFFSDTAYLMFHPRPVKKLVPASEKNKELLREWLYSVELCLKTKGEDAMKAAITMQPDVIYILGDGAFTDKTERLLTARHNRKIVINTLGMQVNPRGQQQLTSIAKANQGTYRDVEAAPGALRMAKQNPIKRNNTRGRVWGVTLPIQRRQK